MSKYALIQAGITCFGIGDSIEEAKNQAKEFVDPETNMDNVKHVRWTPEYKEAAMHSDLIIVHCSEKYAEAAENNPDISYAWDCGEIVLEEEIDA